MNDIELLASVLAILWLGILTLVMLLVIRQIGLITLRLDVASQPAVLPGDGLNFGVRVPDDTFDLVPGLKSGLVYVLLVAGTCTPCRELVPQLSSVRTRGQVLALVPGREEFASDLIQMLPRSYEVVRDPAATEVAGALEMERTPAVLEVEDGVATGKAHLFSAKDFQNLIDARDQSDASEIARLAKEGETHAMHEPDIDGQSLERVRFGRNRMLAVMGGGLAVFATRLAWATPAYAHTIPYLCHDAPGCSCCSGSQCCETGCTGGYYGCESGQQCWYVAVDVGGGCYDLYPCCDWGGGHHAVCICQGGPQRVC